MVDPASVTEGEVGPRGGGHQVLSGPCHSSWRNQHRSVAELVNSLSPTHLLP